MNVPLSQSLVRLLERGGSPRATTIAEFIDLTHGRGLHLVIILLCLPFLIPVSVPGLSTVLGFIIAFLAVRLGFGVSKPLPRFLGQRRLPSAARARVLKGGIRFLKATHCSVRVSIRFQ